MLRSHESVKRAANMTAYGLIDSVYDIDYVNKYIYGRYAFSELFLLFIRLSSNEQNNMTKLGVQACQHNAEMFELFASV